MTQKSQRAAGPGAAPRRTPPPRTATPLSPGSAEAFRLAHNILLPYMAPTGQGPGHVARYRRNDGTTVYRVDYQDAEGTRKRVGQWRTHAEAEAARRHLIRERDLEKLGMPTGRDIALGELSRRYVRDLSLSTTRHHWTRVESALRQVRASLGDDRGAATLTPADLAEYQAARVTAGAANRTANIDTGALRAAVRWGARTGLLDRDPLEHARKLPEGRRNQVRPRRALTDEEATRLLDAARALDAAPGRNRGPIPQAPLYHAMLVLGLRWGECAQLEWRDVDLERREVRVRVEASKTGRARTLPLPDGLAADLRSLRRIHARLRRRSAPDPGAGVFLTTNGVRSRQSQPQVPNRHLRTILAKAGIRRETAAGVVNQHALRHTCATRLAREGVPPYQLQRILGHSTLAMTMQIYAQVSDEDLRGTVSDLGGAR